MENTTLHQSISVIIIAFAFKKFLYISISNNYVLFNMDRWQTTSVVKIM